MEDIVFIYPDGTEYLVERTYPLTTVKKAEQTKQLLGRDDIVVSVECAEALEPPLNTKIHFSGEDYFLNVVPKAERTGDRKFSYDFLFEASYYELIRAPFLDVDATGVYRGAEFDLMGDLTLFGQVITYAANNQFGAGKWILGDVDESETKNLGFSYVSTLGALNQICSEFKVEFQVDTLPFGVKRLNLKKIGSHKNIPFEYGKKLGLKKIARTSINESRIVNRIYPYGSSENLPYGYRNHAGKLRIGDSGADFIDNPESIAKFGVQALAVPFDDIKPERIGSVTNIIVGGLGFIDVSMDFDLNEKVGGNTVYLLPDTSAKITFQTGGLAGKRFNMNSYNHLTKEFKINPETDQNGLVTPSVEPFVVHIGDKYIITDINMPPEYVAAAEAKLRTQAQARLDESGTPMVAYSLETDPDYIKDFMGDTVSSLILPGDTVPIFDDELDIDKAVRVTSITRDVQRPNNYSLALADSYDINYIRVQELERRDIKTIIRANGLGDPLRAKMNWRTNVELLSMIFDTEGNYFTDKIKPNSIETSMLSVGAKSQQFALNIVLEPNYGGNPNVVNVNEGVLTHYTVEPTIGTWYIPPVSVTLGGDSAYYIYARCNRATEDATIIFEDQQIVFDQDGAYYYFLIGVLHSPDPELFVRWINLTYGATTINGRFIKTGAIVSNNGGVYIDLDEGTITGRITFKSADGGNIKMEDFFQEQRDFADLVTDQLGNMDGLVETWFYEGVPTLSNQPAINWNTIPLKDDHLNDTYTNTLTNKSYRFVKISGVYSWSLLEDGDLATALALAAQAKDTADSKRRVFVAQPFPPYNVGDLWKKGNDLMICNTERLTGAYNAGDWGLATNYDSTQVVIDQGLVTAGGIRVVGSNGQVRAGITGAANISNPVIFWGGATYENRLLAPFRVTEDGEVFARRRIEMMSSSNVGQAGICGANTIGDGEVRFWAGTDYANRNNAAFRVLANGSVIATAGYIGNWQISSGGIVNNAGDAYIIGRDSLNVERNEFMLGTNVFPSTYGGVGVALFRATKPNPIGHNYGAVFYAKNATNGFMNFAIFAPDGISFLGQTLRNGERTYTANLTNQFIDEDPSLWDCFSLNPISGICYLTLKTTGLFYPLGEGKEITIANRNDNFNTLGIRNIMGPGGLTEISVQGGYLCTIKYLSGAWYIKSQYDNNW